MFHGLRHAVLAIACGCGLGGCALVAGLTTTYVDGDVDGAAPSDVIDATSAEAALDGTSLDPDAGPSDAPSDAPPIDACSAPNVLACTDFLDGCPYGIQVNGPAAVLGEAGTLHVTTDGGPTNAFCYRKVTVTPKGFLYDVDLRVNVIDPAGGARAEIAQVEATGLDYTLAIVGGKFRFVGAKAPEMEVTPNLGLGAWQHVAIDVDYGSHTATVTIGANTPKSIPIGPDMPALTQIDVGFDFLQGTNLPWDVSYDNLLVRAK